MNQRPMKMFVLILIWGTIAIAGFGSAIWQLWNWLMPELFGMPAIGFWQAVGLMALSWLLFGGWRGAGEGGDVPQEGVAVSAIADPVAFEAQAAHTGVRVAEAVRFPDHHAYSAGDADMIRRRAAGRAILCTAKDWVKLRDLIEPDDQKVLEHRLYYDIGLDALMAGIERVMQ